MRAIYLVALDGLLRLAVGLVGVVQGNLQLVDVSLQLLLDPERLRLGALLRLQGGLHRLHGALVVLPAHAQTHLKIVNLQHYNLCHIFMITDHHLSF